MASGWLSTNFPAVLLAVIGVVIFASASTGIAVIYPDQLTTAQSPIGLFSVAWATASKDLGNKQVPNMVSGSATYKVTDVNVTTLTFTFTCSDPAAQPAQGQFPFRYNVEIKGPNKTVTENNKACGSPVTVSVPVAPVPVVNQTSGADEKAARENLPNDNRTAGQGDWTVTIRGSRQGGQGPLQPPSQLGNPTGSVQLAQKSWTASLTPQIR